MVFFKKKDVKVSKEVTYSDVIKVLKDIENTISGKQKLTQAEIHHALLAMSIGMQSLIKDSRIEGIVVSEDRMEQYSSLCTGVCLSVDNLFELCNTIDSLCGTHTFVFKHKESGFFELYTTTCERSFAKKVLSLREPEFFTNFEIVGLTITK